MCIKPVVLEKRRPRTNIVDTYDITIVEEASQVFEEIYDQINHIIKNTSNSILSSFASNSLITNVVWWHVLE